MPSCIFEYVKHTSVILLMMLVSGCFSFSLIHWTSTEFTNKKDAGSTRSMTWTDGLSNLMIIFSLTSMICLTCCGILSYFVFCLQKMCVLEHRSVDPEESMLL